MKCRRKEQEGPKTFRLKTLCFCRKLFRFSKVDTFKNFRTSLYLMIRSAVNSTTILVLVSETFFESYTISNFPHTLRSLMIRLLLPHFTVISYSKFFQLKCSFYNTLNTTFGSLIVQNFDFTRELSTILADRCRKGSAIIG